MILYQFPFLGSNMIAVEPCFVSHWLHISSRMVWSQSCLSKLLNSVKGISMSNSDQMTKCFESKRANPWVRSMSKLLNFALDYLSLHYFEDNSVHSSYQEPSSTNLILIVSASVTCLLNFISLDCFKSLRAFGKLLWAVWSSFILIFVIWLYYYYFLIFRCSWRW